jgi:hypothetical protein
MMMDNQSRRAVRKEASMNDTMREWWYARELLARARALIERPERWTQGAMARGAGGEAVAATSPRACRWCAYGALWHASWQLEHEAGGAYGRVCRRAEQHATMALAHAVPPDMDPDARPRDYEAVVEYNDTVTTTHADILALYERALAYLDAQCT